MTDDDKKQAVRRQIDAFNRHDEEGFVETVAAASTVTDVPTGWTAKGKEGAREFFQRWQAAFPDGTVTIQELHVSGDTVTLAFRGEGTQKGPLAIFPPTNKRATVEFVNLLKIDGEGKITASKLYYDLFSMLQQLGLVPQHEAARA